MGSDSDDDGDRPAWTPAPDPNAGDHPLFWDEIPENPEKDSAWLAMEALKEESTLEERAENYKKQANDKLKVGLKSKNKLYLREAIQFYTEGLALNCSDTKLNSLLLSNRAHVQSLLGNWRKCLTDAQEAIKVDATNVKAFYRAAKAALQLKEYQLCVSMCEQGMALDGQAAEFPGMLKEATEKEAELTRARQLEAVRKINEMKAGRQLADAILKRGWRVTLPQVRTDAGSLPRVDEAGLFHWPVLVMYPETMQQDTIEDFCEEDTIASHLDVMFGPDAPPLEWDSRGHYTRGSLELYYMSHAGKAMEREDLMQAMQGKWPSSSAEWGPAKYGEKAAKWTALDQSLTLAQLLSKSDYVVPGVPLLFAVAKGTDYRNKFLAQNQG